ncbi:MAG: hypothetical protein M1836_006514 [Candelina mexicana]|nr:MAG: hypothetical protein M1836_006514 [Candelina mexicana]
MYLSRYYQRGGAAGLVTSGRAPGFYDAGKIRKTVWLNSRNKLLNLLRTAESKCPAPLVLVVRQLVLPELADGESVNGTPGYKADIYILRGGKEMANTLMILRLSSNRERSGHYNARGKILIQYTNEQWNVKEGDDIICPQQAIYKVWFEGKNAASHVLPAVEKQKVAGNQKRAAACSYKQSKSGTISATNKNTPPNTAGIISTKASSTMITVSTSDNRPKSVFRTSLVRSSPTITTGPGTRSRKRMV